MTPEGRQIIAHLQRVADERAQRARDPALVLRVQAVKAFQHARFAHTYRDLLAQPRYASAARFFLEELYGPHDFTNRDDQFARVVPGLVRLFPLEIVQTVAALGELHALSESLDTAMGRALVGADAPPPAAGPDAAATVAAPATVPAAHGALPPAAYVGAWNAVGRPDDRERQIALMLDVGGALDRLTRSAMLRHTLRLMRGPARAAGLSALQHFLEAGFDTFRAMNGASQFLQTIAGRERELAAALFAADPAAPAAELVASLGG